jgi:serine/threonine protein kinase
VTEPGKGGDRIIPPLGQLALLRGAITQAQLDSALAEQERARGAGQRVRPIGEILVAHGSLTTAQLSPLLEDMKAIAGAEASATPPAPLVPLPAPASATAAAPAEPAAAAPEEKPAPSAESDHKTRRKAAPTPFGKYTILREIGRGGKGVVHEALDTVLDRKVGLKTIYAESVADPKEVEAEGRRFLAEARISASLPKHPHIVSVYEAGEIEGKRYLAMELIQGQSMTRWRRMSSVTVAQQVRLIRDVALALDLAHQAGVVHRDIKPQNILVDREHQPHLTDWGLAKVTGQKEDLAHTVPGKVWGTPVYMSPEHAKGLASLDHRADIYSLGILLYEAIAGRPPFRSDKPSEILDKLVREPVPPVGKFVDPSMMTPLQRALEPVCMKALYKTPAQRQLSAKEFADEITACIEPRAAQPRNKMLLWASAAAAVVVLALGAYFLMKSPGPDDLALADRYMTEGKLQEAVAAFDRALARDASNTMASEGKKAAQKRINDQREAEKRKAADEARREERARSSANEEEIRKRMEARRKADEEESLSQQARLMSEKREADERARLAEEAKKKAEEKLNQPGPAAKAESPAPAPTPAPAAAPVPPSPAPTPGVRGPDPNAAPPAVVAPTGEPTILEAGVLHFEAEDFSGGATPVANVDYHDLTPGNNGRAYRQSDVDISPNPEGGFFVSDIMAGEWLHYTFQGGGRYQIELRYWNRQNGSLHFEIDGVNASGAIPLLPGPDKRGLATATGYLPSLAQGKHDVRLVFDTPIQGLDWFRLKPFMPATVPDSTSLRDAEKMIRDAFKGDYVRKTQGDLQVLAKKLQAEAAKPQKEPSVQYALLAECRDVAAQAGEIALAMAMIDELDRYFAIDLVTQKTDTLAAAGKVLKSPEAARALAEAYGPVIDQAVERDNYDAALLLCPKAETAAKAGQSPGLTARIQARTREVTSLRDEYRNLKATLTTLEANSADPAANLAVGLYRCFAKNDWQRGAPLLAKGSDPVIAALGQKETSPPLDAQGETALADGWREAGEKRVGTLKTRLLSRALHWYEKALPDTPGLGRVKIEGHVEALTKAVYGGGDILRKGLVFWVEPGRDPADPYREHVYGSKVQNNGSMIVDSGGKAIQFNVGQQRGSWIEYPAVEAVRGIDKAGTLFAWIKADNLDYWGGIVNRGGVSENVDDFGLWVGRGNVGAWFNYPDNKKRLSSRGPIPPGRWTLVGVAWDERNAIFYVDGKEEGSNVLTPGEVPPRRNTKIAIGSNPPGGHDFFIGLVGAVMIYNRPLTAPESSLLYMGTRARFR